MEEAEEKECTFKPIIDRRSDRMMSHRSHVLKARGPCPSSSSTLRHASEHIITQMVSSAARKGDLDSWLTLRAPKSMVKRTRCHALLAAFLEK